MDGQNLNNSNGSGNYNNGNYGSGNYNNGNYINGNVPFNYSAPQSQNGGSGGNALAIVSLLAGIFSIIGAICGGGIIGLILSIVGIICASISKQQRGKSSGMAVTGMICSIIGLVIGIVVTIILLTLGGGGALFESLLDSIG